MVPRVSETTLSKVCAPSKHLVLNAESFFKLLLKEPSRPEPTVGVTLKGFIIFVRWGRGSGLAACLPSCSKYFHINQHITVPQTARLGRGEIYDPPVNSGWNQHLNLTSVLHSFQCEMLNFIRCHLHCVSLQIRAITVNCTYWDMERSTSGVSIKSLSWHIQTQHAGALQSKTESEIGRWTRSRLPVDRQTDTVGIWTSCQVVGASSYKETVNLTQEREKKLILTLLN